MPSVRITASPRGHRCGLFHYAGGGQAITVIVRPKFWNASDDRPLLVGTDSHWVVALRECESVVLGGMSEAAARFLLETVQGSINDAVRANGRAAKKPPADGPSSDDDAGAETDAEDAVLDQLVRFSPTKEKGTTARDGSEHPAEAASKASEEIGAQLVSLMQLAARCSGQREPWNYAVDGTDATGAVVGVEGVASADPLCLLSQWLFVQYVEERLRRIRRGYVPVVETLGVVRGRITTRGLIEHAATGIPRLECEHDEFTEATPLFRVLVTTLELIASGTIASRHGLSDWIVFEQLAERAIHLRRLLAPIPSLPLRVAVDEVARIRLSRLQREWEGPLALARQILRSEPPRTGAAAAGGKAVQWWFDTAKLWEQVVEQVVCAAGWEVQAQGGAYGDGTKLVLWEGLGGAKRPDMVAWRTDADGAVDSRVIDAKYKIVDEDRVTASDQYQIFAYSLLAKVPPTPAKPPTGAALVYPRHAHDKLPQHKFAMRGDASRVLLEILSLQYPTADDVSTASSWKAYVSGVTTGGILRTRPPLSGYVHPITATSKGTITG